jgi:hypothetical protein
MATSQVEESAESTADDSRTTGGASFAIQGEVEVHADGTVTIQGLQWMRCSLGQRWDPVPGQSLEGTCSGDPMYATWDDAHRLARELNESGGFAGYDDWRLPTIEELSGLLLCSSGLAEGTFDFGDSEFYRCLGSFDTPTIDTALFPNTPSADFWSGSPAGNWDIAWYVSFEGVAYHSFRRLDFHVRLVRGGQ